MDTDAEVKRALTELLPAMTADGGGAEIILISPNTVSIRLTGTCLFCPSRKRSALALEAGLKKRVPQLREVLIEYPPIDRRSSGLVRMAGQ
jgi:Fe-S cluster biogenesis protein NfuA